MTMPVIPPPLPGSEDLALWRDAMRRTRRWFSVATGKSSPHPRSVVLTATGATGNPLLVAEQNLHRIACRIYVPPSGTQVYWAMTKEFGTIDTTNNLAQFGEYVTANSYLSFDQEYVGDVFILNASPLGEAITLRVVELIADDAIWGK